MIETNQVEKERLTVAFTGDIAFSKYFGGAVKAKAVLDASLREYLRQADHCVGNIEGPVTTKERASGREFNHYTDASLAEDISGLHIDIWNLANNHTLDFGFDALQDTRNSAERNRCRVIGAGKDAAEAAQPVLLDGGGGVGLFSVSYEPKYSGEDGACLNWDDMESIFEVIRVIRKNCRWCVMVVHGGDEFSSMPMPYVRQRYINYLDMGVDVVVGHHPHVVQNYEQVGDKLIFYSLGNFIFDTDYQRAQLYTDLGVLIRLTFTKEYISWDHVGIRIDRENNMVREGQAPAIFMEIPERVYRRLWLIGARNLIYAERKMRRYLKPKKFANYNSVLWLLREVYMSRRKRDRMLLMGKLLSYVCPVDNSYKAAVEYLKRKK